MAGAVSTQRGHFERHILVVTIDRCRNCVPDGALCADCTEDPDLRYDIECPGVTNSCRAWDECRTCYVPRVGISSDVKDQLEQHGEAHGQPHQYIDGRWMTPTSHCYVAGHDALSEEGSYIANGQPGRWPVAHEVGDGTELYLHVLKPAEATS